MSWLSADWGWLLFIHSVLQDGQPSVIALGQTAVLGFSLSVVVTLECIRSKRQIGKEQHGTSHARGWVSWVKAQKWDLSKSPEVLHPSPGSLPPLD